MRLATAVNSAARSGKWLTGAEWATPAGYIHAPEIQSPSTLTLEGGLHTLAEARQKLPGPERAAATAALEPPEEPRSSRAAAKQASPACILQQWVCPARAGAGQAGAAPGGFRSLAGNRENLSSNLPEQQLPNLVKACPFAPPRTLTTHLCNPTTA